MTMTLNTTGSGILMTSGTEKRYPTPVESIVIDAATKAYQAHYFAAKAARDKEWTWLALERHIKHDEFLSTEVARRNADWKRWEDMGVSPL